MRSMTRRWSAAILAIATVMLPGGAGLLAQEGPPEEGERRAAESRIVAVTVYQGTALVTREVAVPAEAGTFDVVVSPLPPEAIDGSFYTEADAPLRVLSTRSRTRAVREDTRDEVRRREQEIAQLRRETQRIESQLEVTDRDLQLLEKLEGFTAATLQQLTERGALDAESTIALADHIMTERSEIAAEQVDLRQQIEDTNEALRFAERELAGLSAGSSREERDAVVTVESTGEVAGVVRLNYLVDAATWRPQYRVRSGGDDEPIRLEYLAAIEQQTGEDWDDVAVTLSTSQPRVNAAPPALLALDITLTPDPGGAAMEGMIRIGSGTGGMGGMGGGFRGSPQPGGDPGAAVAEQSRLLRERAKQEMIDDRSGAGEQLMNQAAALEQAGELLTGEPDAEERDEAVGIGPSTVSGEGPSVTYRLNGRRTIPSRSDQQLVEVAQLDLMPEYYYRAVPVLSSQVFRLADLINASDYVLLPGEASMYAGSDFVGRIDLPRSIAIGEPFTVAFGADPQLSVARKQTGNEKETQGGNQILTYSYEIRASSYKAEPVELQVYDRIPRADGEEVAVGLIESSPPLGEDAAYLRRERPEGFLRWDVTLGPEQNFNDALTIAYSFKLEFARGLAISGFQAGVLDADRVGAGVMGGYGGGFR